MIGALFRWRAHPLTRDLAVDDPQTIFAHAKIIEQSPLLAWIYRERYVHIAELLRDVPGPRVELGCGPSGLERFVPGLLKTDVVEHRRVHAVVDASALPFEDRTVGALLLTNVLHHLREPAAFLREAERVLMHGGKLILFEPSNSVLQKWITNLGSPHEFNDDGVTEWTNDVTGRLSNANNALPWIIFIRDRARFRAEFPRLRIRRISHHFLFAFYLSGGFSYRPFVPRWLTPFVIFAEALGRPLCRWLGFEMCVEIERV